jgi:hypothetical protein
MSHVEVQAGICGFVTQIEAAVGDDGQTVRLHIDSTCEYVRNLAQQLAEVDAYQEISFRRSGPKTLQLAPQHLKHPACPVPAGIIKAIEVAAGLALPKDAVIKASN